MSFVFRAGPPCHVFSEPLASEVSDALERHFGFISDSQYSKLEGFIGKLSPPGLVRKPDHQLFCSKPLPQGSWSEFQQNARTILNVGEVRHLLGVDSGQGVFLPGIDEPKRIRVNREEILQVAGLEPLIRELLRYSNLAKLPVEKADLTRLESKSSSSLIKTYVQLMLSAQFALAAACALWVVE